MIVVDANVLIYAHNEDDVRFAAARAWLRHALTGPEPLGIPWGVIHTFLRVTTSTRALATPLRIEDAVSTATRWLSAPATRLVEPGIAYWRIYSELLRTSAAKGNLIPDAHIAALAIENDATVATTDRDFARFPNVRVLNPLL